MSVTKQIEKGSGGWRLVESEGEELGKTTEFFRVWDTKRSKHHQTSKRGKQTKEELTGVRLFHFLMMLMCTDRRRLGDLTTNRGEELRVVVRYHFALISFDW